MTARERLERAAYQAGYDAATLQRIAAATLPAYQAGALLTEAQVAQVTSAVEVLAQAATSAQEVCALIDAFQASGRPDWRERFWTRRLQIACLRYQRPDLYGLSPCEDDPQRRARHGAHADTAAAALVTAAPAQLPQAA